MISTFAFANTIQLYTEPRARRLFKARHNEVDKMQIHAQSLTNVDETAKGRARGCTLYMFQIRGATNAPPSAPTSSTKDEWLLTRRYSEFASFRDKMLRLVREWETHVEENPDKILVSNALRRPITPNFPRKHIRSDNEAIVNERLRGLCAFVRMLLDVYADLSVYLFNHPESQRDTDAGKLLYGIYAELEKFLQVPATRKEVERRHTAAVLTLEDVQVVIKPRDENDSHPERTCCICLNDYDSDDESTLHFYSELEESQLEALARDKMVKLPCAHHFHEDCVIEWFNTSVSCPLCRTPVAPEPQDTVSP